MDCVDEPDKLFTLGSGSFGKVYCYRGSPYVFKQVHQWDNANPLLEEYRLCEHIHFCCNSTSFFSLPRALAVHLPATESDPAYFALSIPSPPTTPASQLRRRERPLVHEDGFKVFELPCYAMERVHAVPMSIGKTIRELFFPSGHQSTGGPNLCRLYFGKALKPSSRLRFFNSSNFPLDPDRYKLLQERFPRELEPIGNVAQGMGEMLGRMHARAGVDGRDVEFVLAGDGMFGCSYWVIDFNQVREWGKSKDDIVTLISAFFTNDPYYPRPRPNDSLYQSFKKGYSGAYTQTSIGAVPLAESFLQAIEQEQARRDAAQTTTD